LPPEKGSCPSLAGAAMNASVKAHDVSAILADKEPQTSAHFGSDVDGAAGAEDMGAPMRSV
jgi:hypothetical protein